MDYPILACTVRPTAMKKAIYTDENRVFLELLREQRERAQLTQAQLAERLKATQSYVSKVERGERRLDLVQLNAYCEALEVPLSEFVGLVARAWGNGERSIAVRKSTQKF